MHSDLRYTGQQKDKTGLYYYSARYYDPALGQFVSPDTIVPDASNVLDYNRYLYGLGNPVKFNDPSGHIPCESVNGTCAGSSQHKQLENEWQATGYSSQVSFSQYLSGKHNYGRYENNPERYWHDRQIEAGHRDGDAHQASTRLQNGEIYAAYTGNTAPILLIPPSQALDELADAEATDNWDLYVDGVLFFGAILGLTDDYGTGGRPFVLQTGGNTLSRQTLKSLGLSKGQGKSAIEGLKRANGFRNDFHGKIMSNGDIVHPHTGDVIDNLFNYVP